MAIFLSIFALSIVVTKCGDIAMKVQVNNRLAAKDWFSWWSRDSWNVSRKYEEFYPDSYLPLVVQGSFWLCIALGAIVLASSLWKSN
jgi:hypothetical protein